jgi:hypothetical protein
MPSLKDRTVLVIGRGSGIAQAIALANGFLTGVSLPVDGGERLV